MGYFKYLFSEFDPFDKFIGLAKKRSWDKSEDADSPNSHNK